MINTVFITQIQIFNPTKLQYYCSHISCVPIRAAKAAHLKKMPNRKQLTHQTEVTRKRSDTNCINLFTEKIQNQPISEKLFVDFLEIRAKKVLRSLTTMCTMHINNM